MNLSKIGAVNTPTVKRSFTGKEGTTIPNDVLVVDKQPENSGSKVFLYASGISAIVLAGIAISKGAKVKDLEKVISGHEQTIADAQKTIKTAEEELAKLKTTKEAIGTVFNNLKTGITENAKKILPKKKPNDHQTTDAALKEVIGEIKTKDEKKAKVGFFKRLFSGKEVPKKEKITDKK